jgi:hypothetical protein
MFNALWLFCHLNKFSTVDLEQGAVGKLSSKGSYLEPCSVAERGALC